MRKPLLKIILILIMTMTVAIPALAMENIEGSDSGLFGKPTSIEEVTVVGGPANENDNINRSKDSALIPPPFGSESANTPGTGELLTPNISGLSHVTGGYAGNNSIYANSGGSITQYPAQNDSFIAPSNKFTLPDGLYYSDGSIGTLKIPTLSLTVKVYEDESLENLKKGAGHFKSTSCWEGNIAIAAHNRGSADYFANIHKLKSGSRITYATKLGTRTYEVYFAGKISEADFSRLERSDENIITLITCVRDIPSLRWCVQAREIK